MAKMILSARNIKLQELLVNFYVDVNKISDYIQYSEEVRAGYIQKDRDEISEKYQARIQGIINSNKNDVVSLMLEIAKIKDGDLTKESYMNTTARQIATNEFNSALQVASSQPDNIALIVKEATRQKRNEFVFTLDNLLDRGKLDSKYKINLDFALKESYESFGIKELTDKLDTAKVYVSESESYLELLQTNPAGFEMKAKSESTYRERFGNEKN